MTTTARRKTLGSAALFAALPFALGGVCTAPAAFAGDPNAKDLFHLDTPAAPFVLTIERGTDTAEMMGAVEAPDGTLWITGTVTCTEDRQLTCGYLATVSGDGSLGAEYEIAPPGTSVTEFWWPTMTADGRIAVAAALDPFTSAADGGVMVFGLDGTLENQVALSDFGLAGGEVVHVDTYPNGDLAIAGAAAAVNDLTDAMTARLTPDLERVWVNTERPRERDYGLYAYASTVLPDGSSVAIGTASDADYADTYGWLARFDATGAQIWRHWLTGSVLDAMSDTSTISGIWLDAFANGEIAYLQSGFDDWGAPTSNLLVRIDAEGTIANQAPLSLPEGTTLYAMAAMQNGDAVVAGEIVAEHPVIARVDRDGAMLWVVELEAFEGGYPWGIIETADGSIVAVGGFFPGAQDNTAGWVVRLGADGAET